jgi:hypothetical protein
MKAIIRAGYFPVQWKAAQIIKIPIPSKPFEEASSYRPISLLSIMSRILKNVMLKRLRPILEENRIFRNHQFAFRQERSTKEEIHRIAGIITGIKKKTVLLCGVPRHHTSV